MSTEADRLESPAPVIVLLGAAIGLLAIVDAHRRRQDAARVRAFRRLEAELEAERERADTAEAAEQALRRDPTPEGPKDGPEPRERGTARGAEPELEE